MTEKQTVADVTALRLQLLANGWTPLPNRDKRCFLPGWPTVDVTPDLIRSPEWAAEPATGLRVDRDMLVLDVDVDDEALQDAWVERLGEQDWALLNGALHRRGGGVKLALILRHDGTVRSGASKVLTRGGDSARIEVFASDRRRQVGAYGPRDRRTSYSWIGDGPADVRLDALPVASGGQIERVLGLFHEAAADLGWAVAVHDAALVSSRGDNRRVDWVLDRGLTWQVLGHGEVDGCDALLDLCQRAESVRVNAAWEGDLAQNRTRCIARVAPDGGLQVWDSASDRILRVAGDDRATSEAVVGDVRSVVLAEGLGRGAGGLYERVAMMEDARDRHEEAVAELTREWALLPADRGIVRIADRGETPGLTVAAARLWFQNRCRIEVGRRGAITRINPVDTWLESEGCLRAAGWKLVPGEGDVIVDSGGVTWLNSWSAPDGWFDDGCDPALVDVWRAFLAWLLPEAGERAWFERFLSAKVREPAAPGLAVLMYAPAYGTGRTTLFSIVRGLFGPEHVATVGTGDLTGVSGGWTGWLRRALVVTCNEVMNGGENLVMRRSEYARLCDMIDPGRDTVLLRRKYMSDEEIPAQAIWLLATNYPNALPIAPGDRRFAVLSNPAAPMADSAPDLLARLNALRLPGGGWRREFLDSVRNHLRALGGGMADFSRPVETETKTTMVDESEDYATDYLREVLESLPESATAVALGEIERRVRALDPQQFAGTGRAGLSARISRALRRSTNDTRWWPYRRPGERCILLKAASLPEAVVAGGRLGYAELRRITRPEDDTI